MLNKLFNTMFAGRRQNDKPGPSFLPVYEAELAPLLAQRGQGFHRIFSLLEARCLGRTQPGLIVETGGMRAPGNWEGDGQSSLLWREFARYHDCEIHSVDSDPARAAVVREHCGDAVQTHTGEPTRFLFDFCQSPQARQIDLLYLDSRDLDLDEPFPPAFQYLKDLISVRACLGPGSIVAIDDNLTRAEGGHVGNGYLAIQWFEHLGIPCVHQGFQFVWQL